MATQREKEIAICKETLRITNQIIQNRKVTNDMTTHSGIHNSLDKLQASLQPHRTRTLENALSDIEKTLGINRGKPEDAVRLASVGAGGVLRDLEGEYPSLNPNSRADEKTILDDAKLIDRVCQFRAISGLASAWGSLFLARAHAGRMKKNNPRASALVDQATDAISQAESNLKKMTKLAKLTLLKG